MFKAPNKLISASATLVFHCDDTFCLSGLTESLLATVSHLSTLFLIAPPIA